MTKYVLGLALFAVMPAVAAAPAGDISGTWTLVGEVQGVAVNETCMLTQKDTIVTGTCDTDTGKYETTGKVEGSGITLQHGGKYDGSDLVIHYTGKLGSDGVITGTMDVDPFSVSGSFTAKPAAKK